MPLSPTMSLEINLESATEKLTNLTDEQLFALVAQSDDNEAFAILFKRWNGQLLAYLQGKGVPRNDAADIVQETWMQAWKARTYFDDTKAKFCSWLYTIAWRKKFDIGKKWKRRRVKVFTDVYTQNLNHPDGPDALSNEGDPTTRAMLREIFEQWCSTITPHQRSVVYHRGVLQKAPKEVALSLNLTGEGAVNTTFFRAVTKLRKLFEPEVDRPALG